jgi:transcriptional regulator with XRE-family HTH domain
MAFYENFVDLCNSIHKSPTATVIAMGFNRSTLTQWKRGATPSDATVRRIADYFGISVNELLSGKDCDNKSAAETNIGGLEAEFARLFASLTPEQQNEIIAEMLRRKNKI